MTQAIQSKLIESGSALIVLILVLLPGVFVFLRQMMSMMERSMNRITDEVVAQLQTISQEQRIQTERIEAISSCRYPGETQAAVRSRAKATTAKEAGGT